MRNLNGLILILGVILWQIVPMSFAADTTAPTTPTNLTATAVSSSQINLSWTASTDDGGGVAGYKIYRCSGSTCAPTTQIATSPTNSYSNIGLTASTAYTYAVSAYDAAGNESGKSASVSATTLTSAGNTYYVSPIGSNSNLGTSAQPWQTITYATSRMVGGDTLILKDGIYYNSNRENEVIPPSGNPGNYTIIKAENNWQAIIDANGFPTWNYPVDIRNKSYIQIEGLKIKNGSSMGAIYIENSGYIKILKTSIKNGVTYNAEWGDVVTITNGSHHVLVEDTWITGAMRYGVIVFAGPGRETYNVILRRVVVRWDYIQSGQPKAGITFYGDDYNNPQNPGVSRDNMCQNCIVIDTNPGTDYINMIGGFNNPWYTKNIKYWGSMAINLIGNGYFLNHSPTVSGNELYNSTAWNTTGNGIALRESDPNYTILVNQSTIGYAEANGIAHWGPTAGILSIKNNLFYNNSKINLDYTGKSVEIYNLYYPPSLKTPGSTNSLTSDPKLKYITRIETDSPAYQSGEGGVTRGANIIYRYGVSGTLWGEPGYDQLTNENLWSWPYENQIKADFSEPNNPPTGAYPTTNNTKRGFAADGTGLYGGPITLTSYIWEYLGNPCPAGICVAIPDTTVPSTPINLTATPVSLSQINLSWTASGDDVGVTGYKIYRCAGSACAPTTQIGTSATNSYSDTGLTASTAYTYTVSAYDAAGNESGKSAQVSATTQTPSVVATYTVGKPGGGSNNYPTMSSLLASIALQAGDIVDIYPGVYTDTWTLSNAVGVPDNPVIIRGVDSSGNPITSPQETVVFDYSSVTTYPAIQLGQSSSYVTVQGLAIRNFNLHGANLFYIRSSGTTILRYILWKNDRTTIQTKGGSETVIIEYNEFSGGKGEDPPYNMHMIYTLAANKLIVRYNYFYDYDSPSGNILKLRDPGDVEILYNYIDMGNAQNAIDRDAYEQGMPAQNTLIMGNIIIMKSGACSDGYSAGIIKRKIDRDGSTRIIGNTFIDNDGCIERMLGVNTNSGYTYEVSNNIFTGVDLKIANSLDAIPSGYNNFIISGADTSNTNFISTIQAASAGFVGGGDYHLAAGSPNIDAGYNFASTLPDKQYKAIAGFEPRSIVNGVIDIGAYEYIDTTLSDTSPPSVPTNLTATSVSSSQINLSWTASTDNVGVAGYKIYRDSSQQSIVNSPQTNYQDTNLQASTTYTYTVSAYDAAGNESAQSMPVSATTQPLDGPPLKGDVNCDEAVDVLDVQALVNCILGTGNCDWGCGNSADVNKDGSVDVLDVQEVVNIILGG